MSLNDQELSVEGNMTFIYSITLDTHYPNPKLKRGIFLPGKMQENVSVEDKKY